MKWLVSYDEAISVRSRNDKSDTGTIIHRAKEIFIQRLIENDVRISDSSPVTTYAQLEADFETACKELCAGENMESFKRAKELLASTYKMLQSHPTIAIHLAQWIAVEQELVQTCSVCNGEGEYRSVAQDQLTQCEKCHGSGSQLWERPEWPIPIKGAIDGLALTPWLAKDAKENDRVLFLEDSKTGRPKTWDELVNEDIQPALYVLYARTEIVPMLAAQGINVVRIVLGWTYLDDGTAVPMYESDFDHELTIDYIASISNQMLELQEKYNVKRAKELSNKRLIPEQVEVEMIEWFAQYEKPNRYCSWCPRSNICKTFNSLLSYNKVMDLSGEIDWVEFFEEREKYRDLRSVSEKRLDLMNSNVIAFMDQNGLNAISLEKLGKEIVANQQTRKQYQVKSLRLLFGDQFIIDNASITDKAVQAHVDRIATSDPEKAREIEAVLATTYVSVPGPRPVLARATEEAKRTARRKK